MLWQGKYQGRSFVQIEARDKSYCSWVLRTTTLPRSLKLFQRFLVENMEVFSRLANMKGYGLAKSLIQILLMQSGGLNNL